MSPAAARDFCFWMILAGLLGSRLFYVIFHWPEFSGHPLAILAYWRGGLMFQGGVLTALAVSPLFLKRYGLSFWPAADVMAPSLALGQALGRLGCFTAGCCYGRPAGPANPLGVTFPPGSLAPFGIPLWPTQLLESAGLLALALILGLSLGRSQSAFSRPGRVAALYLAGAGLLRLLMESLRGDYRGDPVIWHLPPTTLAAALAAILGLGLIWSRRPIKI
jgi:phosphatidylglycerol:prolipoprotein diacylglycerol transferase